MAKLEIQHESRSESSEIVTALIDTGFTEWLVLPPEVIHRLGLTLEGNEPIGFANSTTELIDVYEAQVLWCDQSCSVRVHELPGDPTIGMELLHGNKIEIDTLPGGEIYVEPIDLR